jgi:hypothetical protein
MSVESIMPASGAAESPLLQQLADIAEPAYLLSWQIPVGAYILMLMAIVLLAIIITKMIKRWYFLAAKRQAISLLAQLDPAAVSQINQLLKRLVQHYAPGHSVLSSNTDSWQTYLQQQLPNQRIPALKALLYQPATTPEQQQQFYQFAQCWLKQCHPAAIANWPIPQLKPEAADA